MITTCRQKFLQLPPQAQPTMLFGIIPKEGEKWAANANKTFMDITCDKRLCAIVMDITKVSSSTMSLGVTDYNESVNNRLQ